MWKILFLIVALVGMGVAVGLGWYFFNLKDITIFGMFAFFVLFCLALCIMVEGWNLFFKARKGNHGD